MSKGVANGKQTTGRQNKEVIPPDLPLFFHTKEAAAQLT